MCIQIGKCWERISWSYPIVVKRDLLTKDCSYSCIRHRERRIAKEEAVAIVRLIYSPFQISMEWKSQWLHDSLSLRFIFIRSSCLFTNTISSSLSIKHATGQFSQTQREREYFECEYFGSREYAKCTINIHYFSILKNHNYIKPHRIPFRAE